MQLGAVFDSVDEDTPRGDDLSHRVVVHPDDFGAPGGVDLRVPARLTNDMGVVVQRTTSPSDAPGRVLVQLPPASSAPFRLRLRGMGGAPPAGGVPGDLLLFVEAGDAPRLTDDRVVLTRDVATSSVRAVAVAIVVVAAALAAAWAACA